MQVNWRGVFPAVTTQFNADESLNVESTQRTMQRLIDDGVNGFIMLGTVGENCSLRPEEKLTMLRAAKEVAGGKVPILSGVAEFTTAQAADYARAAEKIGIDGLMVLPGMVYNSDARETVQHFRTVARASGLPIMIYNNPMVYRVDLKTESLAQLGFDEALGDALELDEKAPPTKAQQKQRARAHAKGIRKERRGERRGRGDKARPSKR